MKGNHIDLVVCDGAPDGKNELVTGFHEIDQYIQSQLVLAALSITTALLKEGGTFVAKIFRGKDISLLYSQLKVYFSEVYCAKPRSSRNSSYEAFVVCKNFKSGNIPPLIQHLKGKHTDNEEDKKIEEIKDKNVQSVESENLIKFVICGDLTGFDSNKNYSLSEGAKPYEHKDPTQMPINAPYLEYMSLFKK